MSERCSICHAKLGRCDCARCNCDQALALCGLLAEARDIIAEHAPMAAGIEWMERLHRSPHFNDPEPPQ